MTLNKRALKKIGESMRVWFTEEQERIILELLGSEPEPHVWTEQDIFEQIRIVCRDHPRPKPNGPPWMANTATANRKSGAGQPESNCLPAENAASGNPKTQVKISVAPELASAFKKACAASNASMAATLSGFMSEYSNTAVPQKKSQPDYSTRRRRRAAVKGIIGQLENIRDREEELLGNIPENMQGSIVSEKAEEIISFLDEAIDSLESIGSV